MILVEKIKLKRINQKTKSKISKLYISKFQMERIGKGKRKYLFTNTDIYERKHVRSDPQISRESARRGITHIIITHIIILKNN